jgi:hypothetical protein
MAQTHPRLEVLVSDDASSDPSVTQVAKELAAGDSRVRFTRQPRNLGHAANYQWVLDQAQGECFMWLADDDWIDPGYVSRCVAVLRADASAAMVCGVARYHADGVPVLDERPMDLLSSSAAARVVGYFSRVSMNGPLFSVMRTAELREIGFPDVIGGDWLLVGAMAARGRLRTLSDVNIHRSASGIGSDARGLAESFGLSGSAAARHHTVVAAALGRAILRGPPLFGRVTPASRPAVALAAMMSIFIRFTLADYIRTLLGPRLAARSEAFVSRLLRARDRR